MPRPNKHILPIDIYTEHTHTYSIHYICSLLIHLYFTVSHNNDGGHGSPRSQASVAPSSCPAMHTEQHIAGKTENLNIQMSPSLTGSLVPAHARQKTCSTADAAVRQTSISVETEEMVSVMEA